MYPPPHGTCIQACSQKPSNLTPESENPTYRTRKWLTRLPATKAAAEKKKMDRTSAFETDKQGAGESEGQMDVGEVAEGS